MKNRKFVALFLAIVLLLPAIAVASDVRAFGGWIVKSTALLSVRDGITRKVTKLTPAQAYHRPLMVGDHLTLDSAGSARLLLFGRDCTLTSGSCDVIRTDRVVTKGKDTYYRFVNRGGGNRNEFTPIQTLWRAVSVIDLENPASVTSVDVQIRVVPVDSRSKDRIDLAIVKGQMHLVVGDAVVVEIKNDSPTPMFVNLMDVDCAGTVVRISPGSTKGQYPIPPGPQWYRIPAKLFLDLPKSAQDGDEYFKVIASKNPIDLTALETQGASAPAVDLPPVDDPLVYLALAASSGSTHLHPGPWSTALVLFHIAR